MKIVHFLPITHPILPAQKAYQARLVSSHNGADSLCLSGLRFGMGLSDPATVSLKVLNYKKDASSAQTLQELMGFIQKKGEQERDLKDQVSLTLHALREAADIHIPAEAVSPLYDHLSQIIHAKTPHGEALDLLANALEQDKAHKIQLKAVDEAALIHKLKAKHCLADAVKQNDMAQLSKLLAEGVSVDAKDSAGTPALILAVENRNWEMIKMLRAQGADVNARNSAGDTPLKVAAQEGYDDIVHFLIAEGADINAKSEAGYTPLMMAAWLNHPEIVKILLDYGADIKATTNEGNTALLLASTAQYPALEVLLNADSTNINEKNHEGDTALQNAVMFRIGDPKKITLLLDKGADINLANNKGRTALISAIIRRNHHGIKLLLERGAWIDARDINGKTALQYAIELKDVEAIKLLIEHHAHVTVLEEYAEIAKLLAEDKERGKKEPPLIWTIRTDSMGICNALLGIINEVALDEQDSHGRTALMWAAKRENIHVLKSLLKRRGPFQDPIVQRHIRDHQGQTALDYALHEGNAEIIQMLKEEGGITSQALTTSLQSKSLAKPPGGKPGRWRRVLAWLCFWVPQNPAAGGAGPLPTIPRSKSLQEGAGTLPTPPKPRDRS